jgi:prolyl-tRNA synthetase
MLRGAGLRVHLDARDQFQPGYKYADWEMRGVPVRLELGPKDIEKDSCVLVRRDNRAKEFVPLSGTAARLQALLEGMQTDLLERARAFVKASTTRVESYDEFKQVMADKRGFMVAGWNGDAAVEAKIKEETKATIRVIPMGDPVEAPCVYTGQKGREVVFAQAY